MSYHLLKFSIVLTTIALIALGVLLYSQHHNTVNNIGTGIIEIITNETGLSGVGVGGGEYVNGPPTSYTNLPGNITLPSNVHIIQNEIHDTRYTAILITENISTS